MLPRQAHGGEFANFIVLQVHNTYIHTYIHTHIHTYIHKHMHTHTYIYTYIHKHMHTYIHTHTYIHAHISAISRTDDWPTDKHKLITKLYKAFTRFTNQISFDTLNAHNTLMT